MEHRYQVKFQWQGKTRFGIVDSYSDEAKEAKTRGNLLIEDAILPERHEVPDDNNVVDLKCEYPNEFDQYVEAEQKKAEALSESLPGGVRVGKMFTMPVGDGCAYYVVTRANRQKTVVEWRGYCLDRYRDRFLGYGGEFRTSDIARLM